MLEHVFINLSPCCIQWYKFHVHRGKGSGDTVTQIYPCICTKIMKRGWIHGLTAPYLMGMSQHFYIPVKTSTLAASNGTSPMYIGHRVQEIWLHKVTHARQNHKTWLTSWAYSSKSDGDDTHHVRIFRKYRNRPLIWCTSGLDSTCVHELQVLESHQLQRLQAGPGFLTWRQ